MGKKKKEQLNKYLNKEISKAKALGISLYEIDPEVYISHSETCFGMNKQYIRNGKVYCRIYLSSFTRYLDKKEIKAILMHEVLHSTVGSKGHDNLWRSGCTLVKQNYSYNKYEKYHLHEHPYSKDRAKKFKHSGLCA